MIKNLFSKALWSVVMDKTARDKLETRKRARPAPAAPAGEDADAPAPMGDQGDNPAEDPVDDRRARERRRRSLLDSLSNAKQRLSEKPKLTPERKALLQEMQAVQKAKAHLLDELTPEQREKLHVVAMETLNVEPEASKRKPRLKPRSKGRKGGG
ncbi:MAG: hypothetical protein ACE5GT_11435 [Rhodospirillales bacterium]